ncbi:MAG: LysR family transcriptional regulator, partial [Achromobacter piechaudii]
IRRDLINPLTRQVYDMLRSNLGLAQQADAAAQAPQQVQ